MSKDQTKKCSKCKEEKELGEFSKNRTSPDGYQRYCKICMQQYSKQYKKEHVDKTKKYRQGRAEELKDYFKQYNQEHKERKALSDKIYYNKNKDKIQKYRRQYQQDNREKIARQKRKYYEDNKELVLEQHKQSYQRNKHKRIERAKQYYQENKEELYRKSSEYRANHLEQNRQYQKKYRDNNKEKVAECQKEYIVNNREKVRKYRRKYRTENKDKINERRRINRQKNPLTRIKHNIANTIRSIYKKLHCEKGRRKTFDILKYSAQDLHIHLTQYIGQPCARCQKIIINFNNSHIDHIIPLNMAKTEQDIIELYHFSNLRLICETCNVRKNASLDFDHAAVNPVLYDKFVKPVLEEENE